MTKNMKQQQTIQYFTKTPLKNAPILLTMLDDSVSSAMPGHKHASVSEVKHLNHMFVQN